MNIRCATLNDIETLFEIRTSVVENYQSREEIAELGITPQSVAEMLQTTCRAWLADIDGQSAGFAIADAAAATIVGLFVRPAFEGRGAGRALMDQAEHWLRSQGLTEIWLLTGNNPKLRAYGFYLHLGWQPREVMADGPFKGELKLTKQLA